MRGGRRAGEGGDNAGEWSRYQVVINQTFSFVAQEFRRHCTSSGKLLWFVETYKLSRSSINVHLVIAVHMAWWAREMGEQVFVIIEAGGEAVLN